MSSKKGKKTKGKTMTLQNFLGSENTTPSFQTTETRDTLLRRPIRAQQSQQKRDGNSDSSNWRGLENPVMQQEKSVSNIDKHFPSGNLNVKNGTHMESFDTSTAHDTLNDSNPVHLSKNQRSEFFLNNKTQDFSRVLSSGRGRGFGKDTAHRAGPWQTKQKQDINSGYHSYDRQASDTTKFKADEASSRDTAWRKTNQPYVDPDSAVYTDSFDTTISNEASPAYVHSEDKLLGSEHQFEDNKHLDTDMPQNVASKDFFENVPIRSSTAEESYPVDKKPKVEVKPETKSSAGSSSGVSSSTGATKKKPNEIYRPPNVRADAKLEDNRDHQFKKPNPNQRNRSRSRDEKHGQRSRSHSSSSSRHHSQDRKPDKNARQSRGDNVQKGYMEPKFDVFDQFLKWKDSNYKNMEIKCKLIEVNGDLFDASEDYALAHCVAEDFGMGSGIAVQFRQQFKRVDDLLDQRTRQGGVAYLEENKRYIFYMVTKKKSSGKPTYGSFCKSLYTLRQKIEELNVKKLAIPRIGCGLDRLEWSTVWKMIEFIFAKTDVEIVAYNYVQKDEPTQQSQKIKTCKIVHAKHNLISIQSETGLVFLASEDHKETPEIMDIDKKFNIAHDYRNDRRQLGDVFQVTKKGEYIYGLYIKRKITDIISYKSLAACLKKLQKDKDLYYIGIQAFVDENDDDVMEKIQTMCKNFLFHKAVYICWPDNLAHKMPYYS